MTHHVYSSTLSSSFRHLRRSTASHYIYKKLQNPSSLTTMATFIFSLLIFFFIFYQAHSFIFSVTKHQPTNQYLTQIYHGTPLLPTNLVLDLNRPFLGLDCGSRDASSSRNHVPRYSIHCAKTKPFDITIKNSSRCNIALRNDGVGMERRGELVEDVIAVGSNFVPRIYTVRRLLFACAQTFFKNGLASGAQGVLGLGKSQISLLSQLGDRKFVVCLSSTNGVVSSGSNDMARLVLSYTPLIPNVDNDHLIKVKSIIINGERLQIQKSSLNAKISTVVPYTTLQSSVYDKFVESYVAAADSMKMKKANPVAPFEVCFRTEGSTVVPRIELVLQSEMVKWRIDGRNSMVDVGGGVSCLGILKGGDGDPYEIVIGGFQLEDNVLEFDLGTSMLGFGSLKDTGCSNFKSKSILKASF